MAAYYGQVSVIEYLVRNQSVSINLKAKGSGKTNGMTPLYSAVYGCFKRRNRNFKETIDMLRELEADPKMTIKFDKKQATAQQVSVSMMKKVVKDYNGDNGLHYDYFKKEIEKCAACKKKKTDEGKTYWFQLKKEMFTECFNKCSDAPCYPKFS